ncbi:MAG: hypothetical protein HN742_34185 [Lentisphaerae bacterium]|jgi:hypothetical protein|nr:hypothetical protein [Lentisphaerota bacterium]MBT6150061.1 hypothetical protein [Gemmatimonadota bacterium]MBT4821649.1 hypothetical protein [Lentisphaerota bacterium]MBT5612907.1 hypothetical protein [Lentisphaerota bacterium]MBT7060947.1 hypothetical protein [Lentisphaerota bacterium]
MNRKNEKCNAHIRAAFELAREMTILADEGETDSLDDGCVLLYSVVRDCAYRIRKQAEREREAHVSKGTWASSEVAV